MVSSRKRKETVQSSTLHDFFASSPVKKPKCGTSVAEGVAEEDIIVISDDEDHQMEESRPHQPVSISCRSPRDTKVEPKSKNLTLSTSAPLLEHQTLQHESTEDWFEFHALMEKTAPDIRAAPRATSFSSERDSRPPMYGNWAMGDDEDMFSKEEEEEDIEMEEPTVQLCQGRYSDADNACPVCGTTLKGLLETEVERHVNTCIDALTSSSQSTKAGVITHSPLSAVQPPYAPPPTSTSSRPASAFSVLMSSHKENDAWKEASETENKKSNFKGRRPAPFYKVMQGMPIAVDAFRYGKIPGVTAYFLTHAHSDHYTNLASSWKHGPIYCSQTTANLIIHMLNVDPKWVCPLPMDEPTVVPNSGGVEVTLIQANHCPGSVLFLFKGRQTVNAGDSTFTSPFVGSQRVFRYLHCGDFRACPQHVLHSEIKGKNVDTVYLDTTYLDPKYCFPPQPLVISACAELARRIVRGDEGAASPDTSSVKDKGLVTGWVTMSEKGKEKAKNERVLVVVGTYTIGKERIVKAIATALSTKVYCDKRKTAVLRCLSDPELYAMLTSDPFEAGVHVVPLHTINSENFKDYLAKWNGRWTKAVGFRPTGWTYTSPSGTDTLPSIPYIISRDQGRMFSHAHLKPMRNSTPSLMLYGVPYSEHSSFFELTCFALSLDWAKMIATVNVESAKSRAKMTKWFEKWRAERSKREKADEGDVVNYRRLDYW